MLTLLSHESPAESLLMLECSTVWMKARQRMRRVGASQIQRALADSLVTVVVVQDR